jgi:hypothetical protein
MSGYTSLNPSDEVDALLSNSNLTVGVLGLLDSISGSTTVIAAYSMGRKLKNAYSGSAFRVR